MITAQSIYIHIPFCKTKCPYCDFASWANKEQLIERYFEALIWEIKTKCKAYQEMAIWQNDKLQKEQKWEINTIFIGGGTPSLIAPTFYEKVFNELRKYFEINIDCEITLELNPGTAREDYLEGYKKLEINRISIGAQSFNEEILNSLGRKHSVDDIVEAINKVKNTKFNNFSLDLIFAVPGITKEIWIDTIKYALKFEPTHISAYSLIIEPNTPFEKIYRDPKLLPSDDFSCELYLELCRILKSSCYVHYEISNFAKPSFESKHNFNYWLAKEYFAFGVSAHRYLNGMRSCNVKDLETYFSNQNVEQIIDYPLNYDFERIMLNSRLINGFDINLLEKVASKNQGEITRLLNALSKEGYIELSNEQIHLTDRGMFLNNEILLKLI